MLKTLRQGGNFVLRLFDMNSKFTIDLIFILYRYFEKISILKPLYSRAIESERYLVCIGLQKEYPTPLLNHLILLNEKLNEFKLNSGDESFKEQVRSERLDINGIIEPAVLKENEEFLNSIQGSNMK